MNKHSGGQKMIGHHRVSDLDVVLSLHRPGQDMISHFFFKLARHYNT